MNRLDELEAFVSVVDAQSFTAAGDRLGIARSMLSRRVSELEKRLGVQLLQRTTRRLALTDSGRQFYLRTVQNLADLDEAEQFVSDEQCKLSGKIRLGAPLGFSIEQLAQPISEFMGLHPAIEIDIDMNDRQINLIEENIDLAIRIGDLAVSNLIARRLATVNMAICASPAYLGKYGEPKHPAELSDHQVTVYSNETVGRQWFYEQDGKRVSPRMNYRLSANSGEFLARAACEGIAITTGPLFYLQKYIDEGDLIPVLRNFPQPGIGMFAVYPPGRLVSRRVKKLSDFLRDYFRDVQI